MRIEGFDWDLGNIDKIKKHGLPIKQIEEFLNSDPYVWMDEKHLGQESRFIAFDQFNSRPLFVAFTIRAIGRTLKFRVISARYGRKKEMERFYARKEIQKKTEGPS